MSLSTSDPTSFHTSFSTYETTSVLTSFFSTGEPSLQVRWRTFGPIEEPSWTTQTSVFYLGLRKIIYIVCSVDGIYISVGTLIDTCRHDAGMVAARAIACRHDVPVTCHHIRPHLTARCRHIMQVTLYGRGVTARCRHAVLSQN